MEKLHRFFETPIAKIASARTCTPVHCCGVHITYADLLCPADMAVQNAIGDSFRGATWVALHNGGGVGW